MLSNRSGVLRFATLSTLCCLGVATLLWLAIYTPLSVPAEDAVILHQYSRNLAETGVISYIPGGAPAEGATDFLWMLYIALGMKLHVSPEVSSAIANVTAIFGLAYVTLRLARVRRRAISMLLVIGLLSLFPQIQAAVEGFSVLPFGLAIAATAMCAIEGNDTAAALGSLVLCLIRPDGVVFAVSIIVLLRLVSSTSRLRTAATYVALFVVPGLVYFFWRWHYFGQLLPLPFLVKSNQHRTLGLFITSSVKSLAPFVLFAAVSLGLVLGRRLLQWQNARLYVALMVIPVIFYANIRLDQDLNERFFVFIPIGILIIVATQWKNDWAFPRMYVFAGTGAAYFLLIFVATAHGVAGNLLNREEWIRIRGIGTSLQPAELRGRMLTTEAGFLPYFSRWRAYDAWGLDTPEFARQIIQPDQVVALNADLIVLHRNGDDCSPQVRPAKSVRSWSNMIDNIESGVALMRSYDVWRVPYWSPTKERVRIDIEHKKPDYECWYISRSYQGRVALGKLLPQFGGTEVESSQEAGLPITIDGSPQK